MIPENGLVRVSVFNTGTPIPEEAIPNLWTKFYKVDKARTRAYGGTGIGLSIVKAIMDAHNQQYGVKNWENEGEVADFLTKILNKEENDHSGLIYGMGSRCLHAVRPQSRTAQEVGAQAG